MTHKTLIKISLLLVLMLTGPLSAAYAQKGAAMKGMVRDEFGKPLVGVAIRSANGNNRSVTQKDGSYSIDVNDGSDRVVFSYLGYADQSVPYRKGADVDVKMLADGHYGDQTIHMGYTDQKFKDVSGAVSVVTGDELRKSPVASLSQALTGRLTGPLFGRVPVRAYARKTLRNRTRTPHPELQHDAAGSHRRHSVLV